MSINYKAMYTAKTEGQLEKATKQALQDVGCLVYKFTTPSKRGVPDDIVICKYGAVVFIEFKSPKGSGALTPLQKIEVGKLKRHHAEVWVVSSSAEAIAVVERCQDA